MATLLEGENLSIIGQPSDKSFQLCMKFTHSHMDWLTLSSQNFTSSSDQVKNIPIPAPNMPIEVKNNSTSFASRLDEIPKFKNTKTPAYEHIL